MSKFTVTFDTVQEMEAFIAFQKTVAEKSEAKTPAAAKPKVAAAKKEEAAPAEKKPAAAVAAKPVAPKTIVKTPAAKKPSALDKAIAFAATVGEEINLGDDARPLMYRVRSIEGTKIQVQKCLKEGKIAKEIKILVAALDDDGALSVNFEEPKAEVAAPAAAKPKAPAAKKPAAKKAEVVEEVAEEEAEVEAEEKAAEEVEAEEEAE